MDKYTVCAWGESMSVTVLELERGEVAAVVHVFDAVNKTAEANDSRDPYLYLFEGVVGWDDINQSHLTNVRPINDALWRDSGC